jgi:hypothetical protein
MDPYELQGRWALARRIVDRSSGGRGRVLGELSIVAEGAGLRWQETGRLWWGEQTYAVTRTTLLRRHGDTWWMEFEDGRPFHPWRPGILVEHDCAGDVYRGVVDVRVNRIRTLWDVNGPTKSQRLITRFTR